MMTRSIVALMLLLEAVRGQDWLGFDIDLCGIGSNPCNSADLNTLEIILYRNEQKYHFTLDVSGAGNTYNSVQFNRLSETVVFIYGYTGSEDNESSQQMRQAYASLESTTNFFIVNTSVVFGGVFLNVTNYVQAAQKTVCVGNRLAIYLAELHRLGVSQNDMHVIGHSLGGQTAHSTGVSFPTLTRVKLGRITGLDPAGPCFDPSNVRQLNANDATRVDIIHSNAGGLGTALLLGHADFVPNGGSSQPGCDFPNLSCYHNRCSHLYRESVMSDQCIYAPVIGVEFLLRYFANTNSVGAAKQSGYRWDGTGGDFQAVTNNASPFCKGAAGLNQG